MDKQSHVIIYMKIFIYSPQREISQIISDNLSYKGNQCIVFITLEDLSSFVRTMEKGPDLLILDYISFNHDIFNIYAYLKLIRKPIHVIFYNDPCLTRSSRSAHWKAILELTSREFPKQDFNIFNDVFTKLEQLIDSEEFSPYVSLLQPPKKIPETLIKDKYTLQYMKENSDDCITAFKERNKIPNNLYYLLSLLQKNKETSMNLNQIIDLYKMDGKKITEKSLRVLISKLKNLIRADKQCGFLIYQDKGNYRFVRYKY